MPILGTLPVTATGAPGADWTSGEPNSAATNVCITNGTSTVTLNTDATVADLQLASGNTLTTDLGTELIVAGTQIINAGNIAINGGGGSNSLLLLDNNVTLSGGGTLTLSTASGGGTAIIYQAVGGLTLTNQSTIQGAGVIGFNGLSLINSGTVDANTSGQTLEFDSMTNGTNNAGGLLEATNGGTLLIDGIGVTGGGTITANTGGTVQLVGNTNVQGGTLNNIGGTLGTPNGNAAILDGSTGAGAITINGTYTNGVGSSTEILGTINNKNNFQLNAGGGSNSVLELGSNVTLQGGGTVTMSTSGGGGQAIIFQAAGGLTLTNVDNTIQGTGTIGFNGLTVVNEATINANVSGQTLLLDSITGSLTNTGFLKASNGGVLNIDGVTVNNAGGGTITANAGSTVQLVANTTVQGGTLTNNGSFFGTPDGNSAILDGSTGAGAITINGTYTNGLGSSTYVLGTINNNNNFQLNAGGGSNSVLIIDSLNVTLQGGGTVTMSNSGGGGNVIIDQAAGGETLTNVNNTIQGAGIIGFNGLTVVNEATINANLSGQTLSLESMSGGLTNTAILEASNGGTLYIDGVTVNNAGGGTITANAGSTVQLLGNTTIQGGTLTNNGSFFGTPDGNSAILDGSTAAGAITINGTYTNGNGSTTYVLGTINNNNNFLVTATGNGNNSELLIDSANVTLQGGGTVTLSTGSGGGNALLLQAAGGEILTNVNNTIQGEGIIGFNGLTLVNEVGGTVNANSLGGSQITTLTIESAQVTNQGLIEATNNGGLNIDGVTVNNQGGTISANGAGASVQLFGLADIQGGTLTNNGAAFFGTPNGNVAVLDGSTVSGAVTINGTYTNDNNSTTYLLGTINNQGNIQANGGSSNNSILEIDSATVTLTGKGTVTLSVAGGGGSALVFQAAGGETLENFNNTIQGAGIIGFNGLSLLNDAGGTVLANAPGQALLFNSSGTLTNNGTMEATLGGTLQVSGPTLANYDAGTHTLTGGTYIVDGTAAASTMNLSLGTNPGGEIVDNAANIILNGTNANVSFIDANGHQLLSALAANTTASSGLTIENGYNLTTPAAFANAGTVTVGTAVGDSSTFKMGAGGAGAYTQSGGLTQGTGTIAGNVTINGGAILPGTSATAAVGTEAALPNAPGTLSINGTFGLTSGTFNELIAGGGGNNGLLNISGASTLGAGANLAIDLLGGFTPATGEKFTIMNFASGGGEFANAPSAASGFALGGEVWTIAYNPTNVILNALLPANSNVTATWAPPAPAGNTGNWTTASEWNCAPGPANCIPNNGTPVTTTYSAVLNSAGNILTLDGTSIPASVTVNSVTLTAGTLDVGLGGTLNAPTYTQSGGTTQVDNGGSISTTTFNSTAGTVQGTGTIAGAVTISGGTIIAGIPGTPGTLNINGNYHQTAGGTYNELIASAGNFGVLNVTGNVTLDSGAKLDITTILGFDPANGTTFNILDYTGTEGGTFSITDPLFNGGTQQWVIASTGPNDIVLEAEAVILPPTNDNWLGGTDVWSNSSKWSLGAVPGANNDTFIYSGGNDLVTLNVGSTTIKSLTLGGAPVGFTSELTDGGTLQTLDIIGALTIGQTGILSLTGGSTVTAGSLSNSGSLVLGSNNQVKILGTWSNLDGSGNLTGGGSYVIGGLFQYAAPASGIISITNGINLTLTTGGFITSDGTTDALAGLTTNAGVLGLQGVTESFMPSTGTFSNSGTVNVQQSSTLAVTGALTNSGTMTTGTGGSGAGNNKVTVSGLLTNTGTINLTGPGDSLSADLDNSGPITLSGNGDSVTDSGVFNNNSGGSLSLTANLDSVSVATNFNNNAGASVTMSGTNGSLSAAIAFVNGGTVTLSGSTDMLSTPSFTNTGTVSIGAGETINATGAGGYSQTAGTTQGTGTIKALAGGVTINGGTIIPGTPGTPGTLTINGSYTQGPGGTLIVDLLNPGQFSVLALNGSAALDGTVDFTAIGGFTPATGEDFTFLTFGSSSGNFANMDFTGWSCPVGDTCTDVFGPNSLTLEIAASGGTPTPEPSAVILFGTALAMAAFLGLRKVVSAS